MESGYQVSHAEWVNRGTGERKFQPVIIHPSGDRRFAVEGGWDGYYFSSSAEPPYLVESSKYAEEMSRIQLTKEWDME